MKLQDWYWEAINMMPDDVALKCFGAALKKNELGLDDERKIEILKKRWRDIRVNIIFLEEQPKFTAKMKALADERGTEWLVSGEYYYYINHSLCGEFYDDRETILKEVFLKEKKIMDLAKEYSKEKGWGEEELEHFYTTLLAVVAIRCKFIAMLDFDLYDANGWMRWVYLCSPCDLHQYDRLKTESLAAAWAMHILSRGLAPINIIHIFEALGKGKTEWETGFCYLTTPDALQEAVEAYAKVARHFDYSKTIDEMYNGDVTKFGNSMGELMRKWKFAVDFRKGKVIGSMDYLLEIDKKIAEEVEWSQEK